VFQDRYFKHEQMQTKVLKRPWFERENSTQLEQV
jgi:hypothetical protein